MLEWLFSGRRGRKLVLDALDSKVTAITLDSGDHMMTFAPHELIGRHIYTKGHFDRDRVEELVRILDDRHLIPAAGATIVEVGANIGTQTVYFCKTGKVRRLLAIEPDPRNLKLLARNIEDNGLSQVVSVAPVAISDAAGTAMLHRSSGNHGLSSFYATGHDLEPVEVETRPLGPVLAEHGIAEAEVSLVWMDIEGAEPLACRAMTGLLSRRVPLMVEFSPNMYGEQGTRDFVTFLAGFYERCVRFYREERIEMPVVDIPTTGRQCDYLFLP
nr:FkbM family methyltransferase [Mesorhizobium sp.]